MTAKEAIERSISHNEIVTITPNPADVLAAAKLTTDLIAASDDWTRGNDRVEFWGTDDSGAEWRVHVLAE